MPVDEVRGWVAKLPSARAKKGLEAEGAAEHAVAVLEDEGLLAKWPAFLGWLAGRSHDAALARCLAEMLRNRPKKVWNAAAELLAAEGWEPIPELTDVVNHRLRYDPDPKRRAHLVGLVAAGRVPEEDVLGLLELAAQDNAVAVSKLASEALKAKGVAVANVWDQCPLAPAVVKQLRRLGATYTPPDSLEMTMEGHEVAAPIASFARGVQFPSRTFCSPESSYHWVWSCSLNLWGWLEEGEPVISNRDGRPLAYFAHADGGNYILVMALDSANPADPMIDRIDHYDPDQRVSCTTKLSRFLASLRPE